MLFFFAGGMCRVFCVLRLFLICDNLWCTKQYFIFQFFCCYILTIFFRYALCFFRSILAQSVAHSTYKKKENKKSVEININVNASAEMKTKYGSNENIACVIVYTQHMNRNSLCSAVLYDFLFACQFAFFFQFYGF